MVVVVCHGMVGFACGSVDGPGDATPEHALLVVLHVCVAVFAHVVRRCSCARGTRSSGGPAGLSHRGALPRHRQALLCLYGVLGLPDVRPVFSDLVWANKRFAADVFPCGLRLISPWEVGDGRVRRRAGLLRAVLRLLPPTRRKVNRTAIAFFALSSVSSVHVADGCYIEVFPSGYGVVSGLHTGVRALWYSELPIAAVSSARGDGATRCSWTPSRGCA